MKTPAGSMDYEGMSLKELIRAISEDYSRRVREALKLAMAQLEVSIRAGADGTELHDLLVETARLRTAFRQHTVREEKQLFPMGLSPGFLSEEETEHGKKFIARMKMEHERLARRFFKLNQLTNHYNNEATDFPSSKLAYAHLNNAEQDFSRMVYIEEVYLFPRIGLHLLLNHAESN
jgi:iron-sulfur cluster repair protein YtfE (RIC family)